MGLEPARHDFIDWFNTHLAGKGTFAKRRINPDANEDMAAVKREFVEFWDSIPLVYKQPSITLFDFASLMCIAINETGGRFRSTTERCGRGAKDPSGIRHEGLAYAFDKIPKVKKSYNTLADAGNKTALECFSNPVFCAAHRGLGCSDRLSSPSMPDKVDPVWKGEVYPIDKFPFIEDIAETGFIMQADFYKFRGRGPFPDHRPRALPHRTTPAALRRHQPRPARFQNPLGQPDLVTCATSRDADWDLIFFHAQPEIVSRSCSLLQFGFPFQEPVCHGQRFEPVKCHENRCRFVFPHRAHHQRQRTICPPKVFPKGCSPCWKPCTCERLGVLSTHAYLVYIKHIAHIEHIILTINLLCVLCVLCV